MNQHKCLTTLTNAHYHQRLVSRRVFLQGKRVFYFPFQHILKRFCAAKIHFFQRIIYILTHFFKWICQKLTWIWPQYTQKRTCPSRQVPLLCCRIKIIPLRLPGRRLILRLFCWLLVICVWAGQHLGCIFRAFCTFCTLMSRIISQEYSLT